MIVDFFADWQINGRKRRSMVHWFDRGPDRSPACGAQGVMVEDRRVVPAAFPRLCLRCLIRLDHDNRVSRRDGPKSTL